MTSEIVDDWRAFAPYDEEAPRATAKPFLFELIDKVDFDLESEDLVDGVYPQVGVGLLFGKPGTLKSFGAFDQNMSIAKGQPWGGRHVEQGGAIYIASEGAGGLRKRIVGYRKRYGIPDGLPFALLPVAPNLGTEKGDLGRLIATIDATCIKPAIVTIDTVSKSLGAGDENGGGMQTLINHAVALSLRFQCFVLLVHHVGVGEGAEKRPRGFSGSTGGVEVQILCERQEGAFEAILTIQKQKDGEDGGCFAVEFERVEIGTNKRGKVHSTLVVSYAGETEAAKPKVKTESEPPRQKRLLFDAISEAIDEAGINFQIPDGPTVRAVAQDCVRERYYRKIAEPDNGKDPEKLDEQRRKAFSRAIKSALDAKLIVAASSRGGRLIWKP